MPFLVKRLANRDMAAQMYSAKQSIETVYNAARLYLYDEKDNLPIGKDVLEHGALVSKLGPYGVPLGFNTVTALNQDISLVVTIKYPSHNATERIDDSGRIDAISSQEEEIEEISGPIIEAVVHVVPRDNSLSEYQVAELARMIGFFAKPRGKNIEIKVPIDVMYTDIVLRKEPGDGVGFLTELDMGGNQIKNVKSLYAEAGDFLTGTFKDGDLYITGTNSTFGRGDKIELNGIYADRFSFYPAESEVGRRAAALSVSGGPVKVKKCDDGAEKTGAAYFGSVGDYSDRAIRSPDLVAEDVDVRNFSSTNSFVSGKGVEWKVESDFGYDDNSLKFGTSLMPLTATSVNTTNLYGTKTGDFGTVLVGKDKGIETQEVIGKIVVANSTMNDYSSSSPESIVLDLNNMSKLPDINVTSGFANKQKACIMEAPTVIENLVDCKTAIEGLKGGTKTSDDSGFDSDSSISMSFYHNYEQSLIMNIICNYIAWKRLEQRINMALCKMVRDIACIPLYGD